MAVIELDKIANKCQSGKTKLLSSDNPRRDRSYGGIAPGCMTPRVGYDGLIDLDRRWPFDRVVVSNKTK